MTATKSYPRIENDALKAEEIEALERFANSVGSQTYLASLLSKKLLDWFNSRVHDDFSCDLFADYDYTTEQLATALISVKSYKAEVETLQAKLDYANQSAEDFKSVAAARVEELEKKIFTYATSVGEMTVRIEDLERELAFANARAKSEVAQKDDEIIRLKAKLYDMIEKQSGE